MPRLSREKKFVQRILIWFRSNERIFPWRKTTDPYKILVVEHLLRKTTAKQVSDIYDAFFTAFPDLKTLSEAPKSKISSIIRPLGLQNQRSKSLHQIAIKLASSGKVPLNEDELMALPGIGQYGADAVRCLAYAEVTPMVDRNVVRVIDRVFSILGPGMNPLSETAAKAVRDFVKRNLLNNNTREFNLALLDFAAKICKAKNPLCSICPQKSLCNWKLGKA
jgi:A/G-specific adenine glycosylase